MKRRLAAIMVADIDPDAKLDVGPVVTRLHRTLDRNRTIDGVHGAYKFNKRPVTHQLDDTAMVLGDYRVNELGAVRLKSGESPRLVIAHEATVAYYVGGKNGGESALHGAFPLGKIVHRTEP